MHARSRMLFLRAASVVLGPLALAALIVALLNLPEALSDRGTGTLGYEGEAARVGMHAAHRILSFTPESPLPAAGIVQGDLLIAPRRGRLTADDAVDLRILHDGQERVVSVVPAADPLSATDSTQMIFETALGAFALLLGALLAIRRWQDETSLALANFTLAAAAGLATMMPPPGPLAAAVVTWYASAIVICLLPLTWMALSMARSNDASHRWIVRSGVAIAAAQLFFTVLIGCYFFGLAMPGAGILLLVVRPVLCALALALCIAAFARAWRRVQAEQRERLRWLFVGFSLGLLCIALTVLDIGGVFGRSDASYYWTSIPADGLAAAALGIIGYAILRRRVIDVGFAVSRAIVYAIVTGLVLIGFGVVEWLVDHVLEFEERRNSAFVDGALALGVFLVFHRLQHWISHVVERLFFSAWHAKAEALDRYLELTEHYTDADALGKSLLGALDAYGDAAGSAFYERDTQGRFVLHTATSPAFAHTFAADDPLVVQLKAAFGKPLELSGASRTATWAFPIARRGQLVAFVEIGEKRTRDVYRPDEIANIARSVRRVGLDIYALRLEQLAHRAEPTPIARFADSLSALEPPAACDQ